MDAGTDPVIVDLLNFLKENLPEDAKEEDIFKKVHRVQKLFDWLMSLFFQDFYNYTVRQHIARKSQTEELTRTDNDSRSQSSPEPNVVGDDEDEDNESVDTNERKTIPNSSTSPPKNDSQEKSDRCDTLEELVSAKLEEIKEYIKLNEEKQSKTKKLDATTEKLDLKKEHYKLITSIRLDNCKDLISRYNRLMSKK